MNSRAWKRSSVWKTVLVLGLLCGIVCTVGCRFLRPSADIRPYVKSNTNEAKNADRLTATFLGVSSLLFDDGQTKIMIDGFLTRPSIWKVALSRIANDTNVSKIVLNKLRLSRSSVAAIFVAHSHYDHALDAAYVARQTDAILHGSRSTTNIAFGVGLPAEQAKLIAPNDEIQTNAFHIKVLRSLHSPAT